MSKVKIAICAAVLTIGTTGAWAEKMYGALVPDEADTFSLIYIAEKVCDGAVTNAALVRANGVLKGCWVKDGDVVKIRIPTLSEKAYPLGVFRYMGDSNAAMKSEETQKVDTSVALTCAADAWTGDVIVERYADGKLKAVFVSGEKVNASEQASAINFTFNGMNISLSTITGAFNYETTGFQKYLNNRLLGSASAKGAGLCRKVGGAKQF